MKKYFFATTIVLSLVLISCSQPRSGNDNSHLRNSNDTISKVNIIKWGNSKIAIFPAAYTRKIFIHPDKVRGVFTPNESTIRFIEENLSSNYHIMVTESQKRYFGTNVLKKDLSKYDKQYFGFIDQNNDSLIQGIIINFESDPFGAKNKFETEGIFCNDGWCDNNRIQFFYKLKSKEFLNMEY